MKSIKEIAVAFSNGKFDRVYPYLDNNIVWEVVGEKVYVGKEKVITNCKQTQVYFHSVETIFTTEDVLAFENSVMVRGSAEFKRDGERLNFIKACDVYKFDSNGHITDVHSYCISENN